MPPRSRQPLLSKDDESSDFEAPSAAAAEAEHAMGGMGAVAVKGRGGDHREGFITPEDKAEGAAADAFRAADKAQADTDNDADLVAKAFKAFEALKDRDLYKKAAPGIDSALKDIQRAHFKLAAARQALQNGQSGKKDVTKATKQLKRRAARLTMYVGVGIGAVNKAQAAIDAYNKSEKASNISKNFKLLHPTASRVLDGVEKVTAGAGLAVTAGSGGTMAPIGGAVSTIGKLGSLATRKGMEHMDGRDDDLSAMAEPLISSGNDKSGVSDAVGVAKIAAKGAGHAAEFFGAHGASTAISAAVDHADTVFGAGKKVKSAGAAGAAGARALGGSKNYARAAKIEDLGGALGAVSPEGIDAARDQKNRGDKASTVVQDVRAELADIMSGFSSEAIMGSGPEAEEDTD